MSSNLTIYVETMGHEAAARFFHELGGCEVYLSKKPTEKSMLAQIVGIENAANLAKMIGSGHIKVPVARKWLAQYYLSEGMSIAGIARTVRADVSTVRRWLGPAPATKQMSLFD